MKKSTRTLLLTLSLTALTACSSQPASSSSENSSAVSTSAAAEQSGSEEAGETSDPEASAGNAAEETEKGAEGELFHLRVAYSPSLCQAPLHVAVEKGFFADEGIDAENIQIDAAHVQEAIGADQVDAGFGLIGKFLQPVENGLPIKFTAGIHTGCTKIIVPKDSGIHSVADLKGKRIGVSGLAGAETIVAKRALAAEGVRFDERDPEVEFVVFSKNDLGQALENGAIDVIAIGDPTAAQFAEQYDLDILVDTATSEQFADEYCCASFVSAKLAKEHPEIAAAFTRAVLKASVYVDEHPEETAKIQLDNNYVTGDLQFNADLLKSYNYIPSVQGGYDAIELSVSQLADIGVLKEGTDAKKFTENVYEFYDDVPDSYTVADIADKE
ncbi:ABC transporter substrate-binding protein [Lacrimispora sp. 210928-DFI.3.58]|uniref:ABC transporter substrate-binding protein n=1 Tax=Lacrimispora sp. 210928-DFI.3.58 TaxID=2883214 RepID=UPI001D08425B|nr:ABC transporter substrate-binding protein [Lacrimispora sp. 210928-DFI.3.58]MCB7318953.1 ABC transporter substrate-binding protein [Lacrimispora sp. 210928-DFI.3.58]